VADQAGNARIGDHPGGQHRIGRGEQRAEQERLAPAQAHERAREQRHHDRRDWHRDGELAQWQLPLALQQFPLDLQAVAEQDHDQRDGGEVGDQARAGLEVQHAGRSLAEDEAGEHEQGGQ
jgi:hypothetical protein